MNDERTAPDAQLPRPISMGEGGGSVVALPVLPLEAAHVAEAKRALLAQGRAVDDDAVVRLLWVARCLPVALDVLADGAAGAAVPIASSRFTDVDVELGVPPTERRSLLAVAYAVTGGVIVEVVEKRALLLARDDDAPPCCVVRFAVGPGSADESTQHGGGGSESGVPVTRFTVGSPSR